MKVERERGSQRRDALGRWPSRPGVTPSRTGEVRASPFLDTLRAVEEPVPELDHEALLEAVDRAGERLREQPSLANLQNYRRHVAALLKRLLKQSLKVVTHPGRGPRGRRRMYTIIRVVNEELDALARLVLEREQDRLAIVAKLDQIRGLLLDLYR